VGFSEKTGQSSDMRPIRDCRQMLRRDRPRRGVKQVQDCVAGLDALLDQKLGLP
jgi:hypothetical protein